MRTYRLADLRAAGALAFAALLLAGCATTQTEDGSGLPSQAPGARAKSRADKAPDANADHDGPPLPSEIPDNLASIEDAVPRDEPLSQYGNPDSYTVDGRKYFVLSRSSGYKERGNASWYGKKFQGHRTSSGEAYDMFKMTAAHKTLPIPCYARVTNLNNNHSVVVKINDRGPFHSDRVIDVSYAAALKLGMLGGGETPVEVAVIGPGEPAQSPASLLASANVAPPPLATNGANAADLLPTSAVTPSYLQAGIFSDAVNAATLREQLYGAGISRVELRTEPHGDGFFYRVLIGPFLDAFQYSDARRRLTDLQLKAIPYPGTGKVSQ